MTSTPKAQTLLSFLYICTTLNLTSVSSFAARFAATLAESFASESTILHTGIPLLDASIFHLPEEKDSAQSIKTLLNDWRKLNIPTVEITREQMFEKFDYPKQKLWIFARNASGPRVVTENMVDAVGKRAANVVVMLFYWYKGSLETLEETSRLVRKENGAMYYATAVDCTHDESTPPHAQNLFPFRCYYHNESTTTELKEFFTAVFELAKM